MHNSFLVLYLLFVSALLGQPVQGTLQGTVSDGSGAVIPAAAVSVTGGKTPVSGVTQADGSFRLYGIPVGTYTVKVTYPGFVAFEQAVSIEAGKTAEVAVQLTVGAEKQRVTVVGEANAALSVEPDNNATALVIQGTDLEALPDDPDDLGSMLQTLAGPSAGPNGGQIYVDGFSGGQLPPKNTIREIRINQNPFSAEYDRIGFGRIEILTKPGTDKFHGAIGYNDSEGAFNSRNPYATNKAEYASRLLNANVSGAPSRRASFFFNFNSRTINKDALINAVWLDPSTLAESPVRNTVVTPHQDFNFGPRLDYQVSGSNTLSVRYQYLTATNDNQGIGQYALQSQAYNADSRFQDLQITDTQVLSPTAVSDLRFEYTRSHDRSYGNTNSPAIVVSDSFSSGSAPIGRATTSTQHFELQNNFSIGHKTHTYRFGFRARRDTLPGIAPTNFGGTFTFFGVAGAPVLDAANQVVLDGATGRPRTTAISSLEQYRRTLLFERLGATAAQIRAMGGGASQFSLAAGDPAAQVSRMDVGVFAQDDWRAKSNLTVSYGLRYETQTNIHDWRDVAPRLGVAWAPKAKQGKPQTTVIRGGVGMFYDRVGQNLSLQQLRFNGYTEQQFLVVNPDFFPVAPSVASLEAQRLPSNTYQLDKRLRAAYNMQAAISLEQQLPHKTSVALTYMALHGQHLLRSVNINSPLPGTYDPLVPGSGVRPYGNGAGNIFQYESNGVVNSNEVLLSGNTQFNKRVSLNLVYGYLPAHSDVDNMGSPSNPYNFKQDYGTAVFQRKHIAQFLGSLLAPGKIRLNPMIVVFSGIPYNLNIGHDLNGDTLANDRPAFATDLSRPSVVQTRFGAFDTAPMPGQTLVPRNYLVGNAMWNFNLRIGRTFAIGRIKGAKGTASTTDPGFQGFNVSLAAQRPAGPAGAGEHRFSLNVNAFINNVFNHLNRGGWVGNLSSPLFGQSTAIYLQRETSNDRLIQLGAQLSF